MNSSRSTVCLFAGDSLTEGTYGESYVERVAQGLELRCGAARIATVNAGRGGDTVRSLLARIEGVLHEMQPEWLVLAKAWAGGSGCAFGPCAPARRRRLTWIVLQRCTGT
jgi:hypothetical protein